jgi:hypothetical protein
MSISTTDSRMLELIDLLKAKGGIRFTNDFCKAIDIDRQNITNIRNGRQRFTVANIEKAVKEYSVNPSWLFGMSNTVFLVPRKTGQIAMLL